MQADKFINSSLVNHVEINTLLYSNLARTIFVSMRLLLKKYTNAWYFIH